MAVLVFRKLSKQFTFSCEAFFTKMSDDRNDKVLKKWNLIKEQMVALCALNVLPKGNEEFTKLLSEDIQLKNLNAQLFTSLCYYILGIINFEERNKLIRWPLINIQTHTKFRKGVSAMVNSFQEKYSWAHIKKLPESYFMNPHGYQARVIDFLSRLTNLAIHIALNDPELLVMHSGEGLKQREIAIMNEVISKAKEKEEELIRQNVLNLEEFEDAKNNVCDKCIELKQLNDELQYQLNNLILHASTEGIVPAGKKIEFKDLKDIKDENVSELSSINKKLLKYYNSGQELLSKIKAIKNPVVLCSKDFKCEDSLTDLSQSTSRVCGELYQLFEYFTLKNSTREDENKFYEQLKMTKKFLKEEKEAYKSFLLKMSSLDIK